MKGVFGFRVHTPFEHIAEVSSLKPMKSVRNIRCKILHQLQMFHVVKKSPMPNM